MREPPTDLEKCLAILALRRAGCTQDEVASIARRSKSTVGDVERWFSDTQGLPYSEAVKLCDDAAIKRVINIDLIPEEEVSKELLGSVLQVSGDDILRHYRADYLEYEAIKNELERVAQVGQKPYEETLHKQKMCELARSLQREVGLPHVLEIFLRPGRNTVALSIDQEENHLYQGLRSHLKTGGFSEVLEKIREWEDGAGQYLAKCHDLFKNVRGEIPSDEVIVPPDGEPKPGLIIDDFCGTLCADVVGKVTGYPINLGYKTERHFLHPDLWVLRYGAYGIYLALTTEELEKHQNMHKDLIGKYASRPVTRGIATLSEKLSEIRTQINRQLGIFSDMQRLPGNCELC